MKATAHEVEFTQHSGQIDYQEDETGYLRSDIYLEGDPHLNFYHKKCHLHLLIIIYSAKQA